MCEKKACGGCGCSKSTDEKSSQQEGGHYSDKMSSGYENESRDSEQSDSCHK